MKLWIKIALLNVFIVVGLGILIGLTIRGVVVGSMRTELTRQGESIARNLSDRIADFVLLNDLYQTQAAIDDVLKTEHDVGYIFVTDKDGNLFAHTFKNGYPPDILLWNPVLTRGLQPTKNLLTSIQLLDTEKGFIRDIGIKIFGGMNPEVHIGIREDRIDQSLKGIRNLIIMLTIAVTMVGSVLSFSLSRLITKPLYTLMDFTHSLSRGEFGRKIDIRSKDEVGELSSTFNNLSCEL
ncbi:MAG: HAMP domain-containing protein, partial [Nitrospiraceae bacterium]|nr:HAMP domain-containing protein [Nitrospiraceae bacterium]